MPRIKTTGETYEYNTNFPELVFKLIGEEAELHYQSRVSLLAAIARSYMGSTQFNRSPDATDRTKQRLKWPHEYNRSRAKLLLPLDVWTWLEKSADMLGCRPVHLLTWMFFDWIGLSPLKLADPFAPAD